MAEAMSREMAEQTAKKYVCSRCWQPLLVTFHDHHYWVECSNSANCDGNGYVTKSYATKRIEASQGELLEARETLKSILPAKPKRTEKEILSDLGL